MKKQMFPNRLNPDEKYNGISERLFIATQIAVAYLSNGTPFKSPEDAAHHSFIIADALIQYEKDNPIKE